MRKIIIFCAQLGARLMVESTMQCVPTPAAIHIYVLSALSEYLFGTLFSATAQEYAGAGGGGGKFGVA
jgi:hypothetical protein